MQKTLQVFPVKSLKVFPLSKKSPLLQKFSIVAKPKIFSHTKLHYPLPSCTIPKKTNQKSAGIWRASTKKQGRSTKSNPICTRKVWSGGGMHLEKFPAIVCAIGDRQTLGFE
jgi:hypothetical protein